MDRFPRVARISSLCMALVLVLASVSCVRLRGPATPEAAGKRRAGVFAGLEYLPAETVFAYASRVPDLGASYDRMKGLIESLSRGNESSSVKIMEAMEKFRETYSLDLRNDLLPLVEREFTVGVALGSLDSMVADLATLKGLGKPDKAALAALAEKLLGGVTVSCGVSDEEKLQDALARIAKHHRIEIASAPKGEETVFSMAIPVEKYEIKVFYLFDSGLMVAGFSGDALLQCLETRRTGKGITHEADYRAVFSRLHTEAHRKAYVNLPRVSSIIHGSVLIKAALLFEPRGQKVLDMLVPPEGFPYGMGMVSYAYAGGNKSETFGPASALRGLEGGRED